MALQENIQKRLNTLKPTTVKFRSSTGEMYEEYRDKNGEICRNSLNVSCCSYIEDHTPDLRIGKVLPWMYIGSQDVAHDYNLLKENKITHILSIGIPSPSYDGIKNTFLEVYDIDEFDIDLKFDFCNKIIDHERETSGIVYVHCNAGVSRSATIAAAYLINYLKIDHEEALEMLKNVKSNINPNPGFRRKLKNYAAFHKKPND